MKPTSLPITALALLLSGWGPVRAAINWDIYEHGVVPTFKWSRPFPDDGTDPGGFDVNCKASKTFKAKMYKLGDLPSLPPAGLAPWHDAIEDFMSRIDYMGSWDGVDHKEMNREIVVMEYTDVPTPVRNWIEEQQADPDPKNRKKWFYGVFEKPKHEGERIFGTVGPRPSATPAVNNGGGNEAAAASGAGAAAAGGGQSSVHEGGHGNGQEHPSDKVQPTQEAAGDHHHHQEQQPVKHVRDEDKIVVFPGAAVYEIAPLWVAQGSGACERELNNIGKFKPQAIEHSVIAWVTDHTKPMRDLGKRDIQFTVEAMAVTETEEGKYTRQMWERMYRNVRREERKQLRKERERAKREISEGITRDEL